MFQKLQQKWKVNGTQLFLILCVFAITGTTTAYLTRQVTLWLHLDASSAWYWVLKLVILIFGYQVLILLFAFPFGQFRFFWNYEKKILRRMGLMRRSGAGSRKSEVGGQKSEVGGRKLEEASGKKQVGSEFNNPGTSLLSTTDPPLTSYQVPETGNLKPVTNVAIFASGTGSNAQKLIDYFRNHTYINIALVVCNKPGAGVLAIAEREQIPTLLIEKEKFFRGDAYVDEFKNQHIHFIVLAGFLWKIPAKLIEAYPQRIINIHPALLPGYGGKGMYGQFVHEAVIAAKDPESGISIHYVDELYDHGHVIFQAKCPVSAGETPQSLAQKIHTLEHTHYPVIVEKVIAELQNRR